MTFYDEIQKYSWDEISGRIYSKKSRDVEYALSKDMPGLDDFMALISPAAEPYLEQIAKKSMLKTQQRFGKTIQLYIPMYLSNACNNACVYCGFNHNNTFERSILTKEDVKAEIKAIHKYGFEHILLVTGEDNRHCGVDYLSEMMDIIRPDFSLISLEVQPLETKEYESLIPHGLNTVYIYQETYRGETYKNYHPAGKKSNYRYRLETPDRIGAAGVHKIGLGCLLGLEDWRVDSFFTAMHLSYLEKHYWKSKYSISFPRLRPFAGNFQPNCNVTQKHLVQLICAYRLFNEQVELSLSTREDARFRDNMLKLGVTAYSAGSKTNPGGYTRHEENLEQFSVHDDRSPAEVVKMIKDQGYEAVWKDWDACMQ